jgi:hypothetical protein
MMIIIIMVIAALSFRISRNFLLLAEVSLTVCNGKDFKTGFALCDCEEFKAYKVIEDFKNRLEM